MPKLKRELLLAASDSQVNYKQKQKKKKITESLLALQC